MEKVQQQAFNLPSLRVPVKILFTGYLFAVMWFTSMYQLWILPRNGKRFDSNQWIK